MPPRFKWSQRLITNPALQHPPLPQPADLGTVALTFLALGITTQVIMLDAGTSLGRAWIASAVIFSATSQFAYLAVTSAGGSEIAAILQTPSFFIQRGLLLYNSLGGLRVLLR